MLPPTSGRRRSARLWVALCVLPVLASCAVTPPVRAVPARPGMPAASPMATGTPSPTATPTPTPTPSATPSATVAPITTAPTVPAPEPSASPKASPPPATKPPAPVRPGETDCAKVACVALTFDDGPSAYTATLLDHLDAAHAPATFFLRGDHAQERPALVRRMAAAGHEVGGHTYSHPDLTRLGAAQQRSQIDRGNQAIKAAGATPTLFRPPYGAYDATTKQAAGAPLILWTVDTLDWKTRSTETTITTVLNQARAGSIVLMHDTHPTTVAAAPRIIAGLRERGYTLVRVSDMIGSRSPGTVITHGQHPA